MNEVLVIILLGILVLGALRFILRVSTKLLVFAGLAYFIVIPIVTQMLANKT